MFDDLYPDPVEKRVYERLHQNREAHIEERRRARAYQAQAAEYGGSLRAAFLAGSVFGAAVTAAAAILLAAIVVGLVH